MKKHTPEPGGDPKPQAIRIASLIPYPDQDKYFPYDPRKCREIAASIKQNGVQVPVDVLLAGNAAGLPANTVVAGHTRARAAKQAGLTAVPVRVRHDLMAASRAAVDEAFLADNTARRQLSKLAEARAAVGLHVARKTQAGRRSLGSVFADPSLRDRVGEIVGMSGRNLGRYLNVLEAPPEVQDALERSAVKLTDAARVVGLPKPEQARLADRLRAGDDPEAVFAAYFPPKPRGHAKPADAVAAFARGLAAAGANLERHMGGMPPGVVRRFEAELRAGSRLLDRLLLKLADSA